MKFHKAPKVDPEYFSVISLFANSRIKPIFKLISPIATCQNGRKFIQFGKRLMLTKLIIVRLIYISLDQFS